MMEKIDNILNKVTMYKLVLYYLIALLALALGFSFIGWLPYSPSLLTFGSAYIISLAVIANALLARFFKAPANVESVYITALILIFLITPMQSGMDLAFVALATFATVLAMASKFILAIRNKHIFNPAAIAVAITALVLNLSATWWVGTAVMAPFVLLGGLLIVRKIQRGDLVWSFFIVAIVVMVVSHLSDFNLITLSRQIFIDSPIFFFAFVMLTEPLTTPPTRPLRIAYGAFVGFLFAPFMHFGSVYSTPELALVVGNIFSYAVSPKFKAMLTLKDRQQLTPNVFNFVFTVDKPFTFRPGQYLEWTLPHEKIDLRGNRRYFTIASSPTEKEVSLGVKFYDPSSSFKKALLELPKGGMISAGQLAGDFTLPKNEDEKLVFIAGGIGVTPFRSMIKYLMDTQDRRDVIFIYANSKPEDIAYGDLFEEARELVGVRTVYAISNMEQEIPAHIKPLVYHGRVTDEMIASYVPDFKKRHFYISGTHEMVTTLHKALRNLGVEDSRIKQDFFPGFM